MTWGGAVGLALISGNPLQAQLPARGSSAGNEAATAPAATNQDPLILQIDQAIEATSRRILDTASHSPWQIAHGTLALRHHYVLKQGADRVSALDWISTGPKYQGLPWFVKTEHGGKGHPFVKPMWFEGHPNQFVALFTFCDLPLDFEFTTGSGEKITIQDVIDNAKMEVNDYEEVTWTLWFLSHYLPSNAEWENQNGIPWSMERLVKTQIASDPTKAACGGTHGLFALAKARNAYLQEGGSLRGVWLEADMHLRRYVQTARSMQNSDGSFSANYFRGAEWSRELDKRVSTTGHTLEFLMMTLPQSELNQNWVRSAVNRITTDLLNSRRIPLEPGGMYHALDALVLYRQRLDPNFTLDALNLPAATRTLVERPKPAPEAEPPVALTTADQPAPTGPEPPPMPSTDPPVEPAGVAAEQSGDTKVGTVENENDDDGPIIQSPRRITRGPDAAESGKQ